MSRTASYDQGRLADILRRQHQTIGRDQAFSCGLTPAAVQHRIRPGGPWRRLLPGVYVALTGPVAAEQREMAALIHAGPRSVLTGLAAARRHGFAAPEVAPVDVLVPPQVRRQSTGFVRVQQSTRMPADAFVAGEVRYVRPERAVADAARGLTVGAGCAGANGAGRAAALVLNRLAGHGAGAGTTPWVGAVPGGIRGGAGGG